MIKQVNRLRSTPAEAVPALPEAPTVPEDVALLREIRDALRAPR
jgi:large-conductance mechanosensitive channel